VSKSLRVVFAGTPEFAVPVLEALVLSRHAVVAVLTQPDRLAGRGRKLTASAVKSAAERLGLPIEQPVNLKDPDSPRVLAKYAPDIVVVVAYGLILPQPVLDLPPLGCVNVHASLLPRWRGAAPIERALLAGDRETGISIMRMEAGLDTGPVFARFPIAIGSDETAGSLRDRLAALARMRLSRSSNASRLSSRAEPGSAFASYAAKIGRPRPARLAACRGIERRVRRSIPVHRRMPLEG
jgi:methionyl-tRNA formyltransferase